MNWEIFSLAGYISVALWVCIPLFWLAHLLKRPRGWLGHIPLVLGVAALTLALINSKTYVSRIQADRSAEIEEQMSAAALAQQQAEAERSAEAADIRFAEDATGEQLDKAGLDDTDLAYFESFGEAATPDWKKEKQARDLSANDTDDLQSLIGGSEEQEGVEVQGLAEPETFEPILMSDKDKLTANRLDSANLTTTKIMLLLATLFVVVDYVKRLNVYRESYFPLPLPSKWADALTERTIVSTRPEQPRRSLHEELATITRRGEAFLYLTDDSRAAEQAATPMPRLPAGKWPIHVFNPGSDPKFDDAFLFETLWFRRNSLVIDNTDRALPLLECFVELLARRRESRAHTRQTVHLIWDLPTPIPAPLQQRFEVLARATGFTLLICREPAPTEADK